MRKIKLTLLLAALAAIPVLGQDISGTIEGTVLDNSQGAIANAKVTVTNVDRGQAVRQMNTNADGIFSAPLIPIGNYSLKVEAAGFKSSVISGIALNVKDDLKFNVTLQVGAVTESIEVSDEPTKVELSSVAVSTTITGQQISQLPLGTRNYEQLVALMPGVTSSTTDELFMGVSSPSGLSATVPYSINGNRTSGNNWTVDGADNVDRGSNLTLMTFPSVDSIAEFKVQRSLYSADTGRAGGGQISVVTKSGTSAFHGDVYEYFRNDALAANNWINNANKVNLVNGVAKVPPLRWNDFGGAIGGPVLMHKPGNTRAMKTFFFFSEEAHRIITYTTLAPILPTSGMITGNFPTTVCLTNNSPSCTVASTTIAPSLINPISAEYVKDIFSKLTLNPTSTTAGLFPQRNLYNSNQQIARVDHAFTDKMSVWFKFENDKIPTTEPGGLFTGSAIPNGATTNTNSPGRAYVFHLLETLTPRLLNEVGFNYTNSAIHATPVGLTAKANSPDINVPLPYANPEGVIPTVAISGGSSIIGYGPYNEFNKNYTSFDTLSWQMGKHSLKFGYNTNHYNKTENAASGQGSFSFAGTAPTGTTAFTQAFANFLLGNVSSFTQPSLDVTPNIWAWENEAFVQDDYRLSPRLTVSLGVRWSFFGQPTETNGFLSNFDPVVYSPAAAAKIDSASGNIIATSITQPYTNGIIIAGKNSPFGNKIAPDNWHNFAPRLGIAWDPFGTGKTSIRTGYGIFYDATNMGLYETTIFRNPPFVQSVTYSNAPFDKIATGTVPGTVSTVFAKGTQLPNNTPYMQDWSFSVQQQMPAGVVLDLTYAGSKGTHLIGIVDINQAVPGVALAAGLHAAGGNTVFTATDDPRINAVRPYLGYNAINTIQSAFDSNYHSLQTNVRKQFRSAGLVSFSFTWSKNLTDAASDSGSAPQSSYNWHEGEYGPATLDRQRVANINYVYTIPVKAHGPLAILVKNWQLNGIMSFYSGSPFTVTTSNLDAAGLGLIGNSASSGRPDMICDPNANAAAPHTIAQWFNTACFAATPQGAVRPGNAGRGVVRGPGYENWDASAIKSFSFKERTTLSFRAEALNLFNHPNPNGFGSTNITSSLFGQITTFRAPRRVQLALRLEF